MAFDFDAAVSAPFRMQPGLRRMALGAKHLTPAAPGGPHQREKLAVLSAFWPQALCSAGGFDPTAVLLHLSAHAAEEHPLAWQQSGNRYKAKHLATAVTFDGAVEQTGAGSFGLGDEISRCLLGLPAEWRMTGLLSLAFEEDFAIVDAARGAVDWLAVTLPSHWAPEQKVGLSFTAIHAPVADNALLLQAGDALMRMVSGRDHWERFVWNVTDSPRLHAHPARVGAPRWQHTSVAQAWWRTERQTFIPLPNTQQAVFTIGVRVKPLADVLHTADRAVRLRTAIASMSAPVLAYRGLTAVQPALLAWLDRRC